MRRKARPPRRRPAPPAARVPKGFARRRTDVDGVTLSYTTGGQGPVVVLLHGYAQTSHMWTPLMPVLAPSHTVIAPDLRGAGDPPGPRAATTRRRSHETSTGSYAGWAIGRSRSWDTTSA